MSEIINLDQAEVRLKRNAQFKDGGRAFIVATLDSVGKSIGIETRDNRPGSIYLAQFLAGGIERALTDKGIRYDFGDLFGNPLALSRIVLNKIFGTDLEILPTEREEIKVSDKRFGEVQIVGISYEEPDEEDENDGIPIE